MKRFFCVFMWVILYATFGEALTAHNYNNAEIPTALSTYNNLLETSESIPDKDLYATAFEGYQWLLASGKLVNHYLTIVDFRVSSNEKRLWVIDMNHKQVVFHTLVSHGKNSGSEYANYFSNDHGSNKSSLGFYLTGELYDGKHGLSLRLDGLEPGFNTNARKRGVVIHGANYVSEEYIEWNGRLGRSHGCPAVPMSISNEMIQTIANKSCVFLYYPDETYLVNSPILSQLDLT